MPPRLSHAKRVNGPTFIWRHIDNFSIDASVDSMIAHRAPGGEGVLCRDDPVSESD